MSVPRACTLICIGRHGLVGSKRKVGKSVEVRLSKVQLEVV